LPPCSGTTRAELVIAVERRHLDRDLGNRCRLRLEPFSQSVEVGQLAGIEIGSDRLSQISLAGAIMGERQKPDHGAARSSVADACDQRLKGALVGFTREQLLAIDQIEQRHRFLAQGMDDVPVVDDVAAPVMVWRAAAPQRGNLAAAEEADQPVVVEAHCEPN